jgi:hypothetical protein
MTMATKNMTQNRKPKSSAKPKATNVRKVTRPETVEDLLISSVRKGLRAALKDHYLVEEIVDECLTDMLEDKVISGRISEVLAEELDLLLTDRELVRTHLLDRLTKG